MFTPSDATPDSKLPVWVYIQGGGYAVNAQANYNGTGVVQNSDIHNGTEMVRQSDYNLVFVNFNYRVGALGFLASEELQEDGDLNAGLLDQRKLLYWVQDNIAKVNHLSSARRSSSFAETVTIVRRRSRPRCNPRLFRRRWLSRTSSDRLRWRGQRTFRWRRATVSLLANATERQRAGIPVQEIRCRHRLFQRHQYAFMSSLRGSGHYSGGWHYSTMAGRQRQATASLVLVAGYHWPRDAGSR